MEKTTPKDIYVHKRPNGTYRVGVVVRVDGTKIRTSTTYYPQPGYSEKENHQAAERMGELFIPQVKANYLADKEGKTMTVGEYYRTRYRKQAETYLAETTCTFYFNTIEKLFLPFFENVKLTDVTASMLQEAIQELSNKENENEDCEDPICIKSQTVKRYITGFRSLINFAVLDGTIDANPIMAPLRYPKIFPTNIIYLDDADFDFIVSKLKLKLDSPDTPLERNDVMVAIAMLSGIRRGELVALKWKNIINLSPDKLDRCKIDITHSAYKPKGEPQVYGPVKSPTSVRIYAMPELLAKILWKWRVTLINQRGIVREDDFVISNELGDMVSIYSPSKWFKDYLIENNLRDVKLHSLRHTFASMLLNKGIDLYTLKKVMGHKDIETTEIYLHSFELNKATLMAPINEHTDSI